MGKEGTTDMVDIIEAEDTMEEDTMEEDTTPGTRSMRRPL